jgi:uncharacterized protein YkwD
MQKPPFKEDNMKIALLFALLCTLPAQAQSLTSTESRMVIAVNKYRSNHNKEPLTIDPILMRVARAAAPYYSHQINGKWCWTRCHEAGFSGWATDNIANGYLSPEDCIGDDHSGWGNEHGVGHNLQMLGKFKMNGQWCDYKFNRIGVACSGKKWIAVFGRVDNETKEIK